MSTTMNPRQVMKARGARLRNEQDAQPTLVLAYTSAAQPAKAKAQTPVHEHDCENCTFLGQYVTKDENPRTVDMHACGPQNTGIARYGVDGDYYSGNTLGLTGEGYPTGTIGHALETANRLGEKAGLLTVPLWRQIDLAQKAYEAAWDRVARTARTEAEVDRDPEVKALNEALGALQLEARERDAADGDVG